MTNYFFLTIVWVDGAQLCGPSVSSGVKWGNSLSCIFLLARMNWMVQEASLTCLCLGALPYVLCVWLPRAFSQHNYLGDSWTSYLEADFQDEES